MPVLIKTKGDILTAFIKGEIDHHTAPNIREQIDDAVLINSNANTVVLDFSGVTFMDSSGVGLVMGRYRLIKGQNKAMRVENLGERDYKIMKMSGIEKLCKITKRQEVKRFGDIL